MGKTLATLPQSSLGGFRGRSFFPLARRLEDRRGAAGEVRAHFPSGACDAGGGAWVHAASVGRALT